MDGADSGNRKGPAHARKRVLPQKSEDRLTELGRQLPPPTEDELEIVAGLRSRRDVGDVSSRGAPR